MTKQLKHILVVDVEATCWQGSPPGEQSEIIEVGYALLNVPDGCLERCGTMLVRPERSRVSAFCTGLTTLTQAQVDGGVSFAEACRFLMDELGSCGLTWASYGDYDRKQFTRQCESFGVPYPFSDRHLNVKNLFALAHGLPREVGMAGALKQMGVALEGTHHRAGDDARNIAVILASLLRAERDLPSGSPAGCSCSRIGG